MRKGNNISILNLSYVREVDNMNLLSGELDNLFNLTQSTSPLLAHKLCKAIANSLRSPLCNACCASLFASLQANIRVICGKNCFDKAILSSTSPSKERKNISYRPT